MFSSKLSEELEGSPFNIELMEDQLNTEDGVRVALKIRVMINFAQTACSLLTVMNFEQGRLCGACSRKVNK